MVSKIVVQVFIISFTMHLACIRATLVAYICDLKG